MDSDKILKELINKDLKGIQFYQKTFKPRSIEGVAKYPKYQNKLCYGIKINIINKNEIEPLKIAITILKIIYNNHPTHFTFNNNNFISKLYGSDHIRTNIINSDLISILSNSWEKDSMEFVIQRKQYLLY